jgi:hypothetical protein
MFTFCLHPCRTLNGASALLSAQVAFDTLGQDQAVLERPFFTVLVHQKVTKFDRHLARKTRRLARKGRHKKITDVAGAPLPSI